MIDASKVDAMADQENDVLGARAEGLSLCSECHHFFDPVTRLPAEKFMGIFVVHAKGDEVCGPCSGEPDKWPGR